MGGRARSPPPLFASCSGGVRGGGLPLFPAPRPSPKCPRPPRRCESGSALPPLGRVGRGGRGSGRVALPAPTCACDDQTRDVEKDEKKLSDMAELILLRPLNTVQSTRKTDSTPVPRGWPGRMGAPPRLTVTNRAPHSVTTPASLPFHAPIYPTPASIPHCPPHLPPPLSPPLSPPFPPFLPFPFQALSPVRRFPRPLPHAMDAVQSVAGPLHEFSIDSARLLRRCTKPDLRGMIAWGVGRGGRGGRDGCMGVDSAGRGEELMMGGWEGGE